MDVRAIFAGVIFLFGSASSLSGDQAPGSQLTSSEKVYGFSLFWREVSYNFARWETAIVIDWDEAYLDFLPRIMATDSDFEYFREMQRFCALLKDGHTNVYMPKGMLEENVGRIPLQLREIERRASDSLSYCGLGGRRGKGVLAFRTASPRFPRE